MAHRSKSDLPRYLVGRVCCCCCSGGISIKIRLDLRQKDWLYARLSYITLMRKKWTLLFGNVNYENCRFIPSCKCDERHDFGSNDKAENAHLLHLGKYCCMVDLLFYLFGFSCVANVELLTILLFGRIQTQVILTKWVSILWTELPQLGINMDPIKLVCISG